MHPATPAPPAPHQPARPQPPTPCRIRRVLQRRSTRSPRYGGNRRLTPTDAITAPASSTPRAPVGRFRGLPVADQPLRVRAALGLPGLAVSSTRTAFEEVDALAARGAFACASHNPSCSRGSEAIRSIARKQAPRRLGADSDNAAFERPRPSGANSGDTAASLGRIGSDRCHGLDCCSRRKPAASQQARVRRSLRETKRQSPITASADDS